MINDNVNLLLREVDCCFLIGARVDLNNKLSKNLFHPTSTLNALVPWFPPCPPKLTDRNFEQIATYELLILEGMWREKVLGAYCLGDVNKPALTDYRGCPDTWSHAKNMEPDSTTKGVVNPAVVGRNEYSPSTVYTRIPCIIKWGAGFFAAYTFCGIKQ